MVFNPSLSQLFPPGWRGLSQLSGGQSHPRSPRTLLRAGGSSVKGSWLSHAVIVTSAPSLPFSPCPGAVSPPQRSRALKGHLGVALEGWDKDTTLIFPGGEEGKSTGLSLSPQGDGEEGTCIAPLGCVGHKNKNKIKKKPTPNQTKFVFYK